MYNPYGYYPNCGYNVPAGHSNYMGKDTYNMYPNAYENNYPNNRYMGLRDYGPEPFVINIEDAAKRNNAFRTAIWTGNHLQVTLMSIDVGEDIGLEIHPNLDQFIRIEQGQGIVLMGDRQDYLNFQSWVYPDYAFIIPAGKWHNLVNTGHVPIKLYSIYAPPQHPRGTVHVTRADAMAAE
ncbi:MAG: cupin domain-containing protein [Clostridiaceae bacterium]|jgi:mannose-6-phosphate isomerase-like protein (cupin superfamily)|nr:cupin domain-containing protein [Bacillota bacterium]NLI38279.1 cupin domain-containing protein [Clostridiaceae bacterium]